MTLIVLMGRFNAIVSTSEYGFEPRSRQPYRLTDRSGSERHDVYGLVIVVQEKEKFFFCFISAWIDDVDQVHNIVETCARRRG